MATTAVDVLVDPSGDLEQIELFECPACDVDQVVVDSDSIPSMLGFGEDHSLRLACGHDVTFDPFTGEASAR